MKKKILLIDDDQDLVQSFKVNLENSGYDVITASDGHEGFTKLENEKPDLLVLDVMMDTNFEGYYLLHRIKGNQEYLKLPIIISTGMDDKIGINMYSGFEDVALLRNVRFQKKPIEPLILVKLIEELLKE